MSTATATAETPAETTETPPAEPVPPAAAAAEEPAVTAAAPAMPMMPKDEEDDEKKDDEDEMPPMADSKGTPYRRWRMPVAILEGTWTGDNRFIEAEAVSWRDLPRSLAAKTVTSEGHDGAEIVGRIDAARRVDASQMVDARTGEPYGEGVWAIEMEGVFLNEEFAARIAELIEGRFLRGVSVDMSDADYILELVDGQGRPIDETSSEEEQMAAQLRQIFTAVRIIKATVVPDDEAMEGAFIQLVDDEGNVGPATLPGTPTPEQAAAAFRVTSEPRPRECEPCESGGVTAAAAPLYPPKTWFDNPRFTELTPITVTDDGRVYGHAANGGICHTGHPDRCVTMPRTQMSHALFRTGVLKTAEGDMVPVGQITLVGGHPGTGLGMTRMKAIAHYDDTRSAVADVAAYDDEFGVAIAGALRPGVTEEQIRVLRASTLSGDWREWGGNLEMIAVLATNAGGLPVLRQVVASGRPVALVCSGPPPRAVPVVPPVVAEVEALLPELRGIAERDRAGRAGAARERMAASRAGRAEGLRSRMGVGG